MPAEVLPGRVGRRRSREVRGAMLEIVVGGMGVLLLAHAAGAAERADLAFGSEEWKTQTQGAFTVRLDQRGVMMMSHPDTPAKAEDWASASRLVDLPKNPKGLVVRFYLTDDYVGDKQQAVYFRDAVKERVSDWKPEVRFAQVLLDDLVIWSKDVLGRSPSTAGERFYDLDISDLVGKKSQVKLTLRVRDEAGTTETFATDVFWARPELIWNFGDRPPAVEFPPRLALRREKFRPTAPPAPQAGRVTLTLKNPAGVTLAAWPVRWGIPLPAGAVTKATQVALTGPDREPVSAQARVTARWPDGSAKWVLLDFVARLGKQDAAYTLQYGAGVSGAADAEAKGPADIARLLGGAPSELLSLKVARGGGEAAVRAVGGAAEAVAEGPVCTEAHVRADYAGEDGKPVASSELTCVGYRGLPVVFVRHTLEVSGRKGGLALRQVALTVPGASGRGEVGIGGAAQATLEGAWALRQESETALTFGRKQDAEWDGWARQPSVLVSLRCPWQQFPDGYEAAPGGSKVLLVDVPAGQSAVALAPGEAKTHEVMIWRQEVSAEQAAAMNAAFQRPPVIVFQPGWIAATNVFGPFAERDAQRFAEYEPVADRIAAQIAQERQSQHAYGCENFGDVQFGWGFGEALTYWANTEYDHTHALMWQFLRTGDPELYTQACEAALHYRDVDLIHADDEHPDWVGGAHHHSESHTKHGPTISHHWTEGLFDHYLLTGNTRSLECGQQASEYAKRVALGSGYGGGERDAGWNLIALMGAYRATGDGALLQAATKKVEDVLAYLDPVRGVSSAPIYEQTAYEGGTSFMTGILMRGLAMYYDETRDERVGWAICGLCDWLQCEMMPAPGRFYYKETPQQKGAGQPLLLALDGTAFAWNFTGDPAYRKLALDVYREGVSTTDITNMRDMPHALALLATALPPVAVRRVAHPFLFVVGASAAPTATFTVANLSGQPERVEVKGGDVSAKTEVPAGPQPVEVKVKLSVSAGQTGVVRLPYVVTSGDEKVDEGELTCLAMLKQPRLLVLAPEDNLTTKALRLLGVTFTRREMSEFRPESLAETDVLVCGFDVSSAPLGPHAAAIGEWVKGGGVVLGFRDDAASSGWLPSPLKQDASYEPGPILKPDSGPFALLDRIDRTALSGVHGGSMYHACYDLGPGWEPLASAGPKQAWDKTVPASTGPHYGLVELRHGKGRVILCQLIPEYAWLNDDAGRLESNGRKMLENLAGYACLAVAR